MLGKPPNGKRGRRLGAGDPCSASFYGLIAGGGLTATSLGNMQRPLSIQRCFKTKFPASAPLAGVSLHFRLIPFVKARIKKRFWIREILLGLRSGST
jgi:hypothetical protein